MSPSIREIVLNPGQSLVAYDYSTSINNIKPSFTDCYYVHFLIENYNDRTQEEVEATLLSHLDEMSRFAMTHNMGFLGYEPKGLSSIGKMMGLNSKKVKTLILKALYEFLHYRYRGLILLINNDYFKKRLMHVARTATRLNLSKRYF